MQARQAELRKELQETLRTAANARRNIRFHLDAVSGYDSEQGRELLAAADTLEEVESKLDEISIQSHRLTRPRLGKRPTPLAILQPRLNGMQIRSENPIQIPFIFGERRRKTPTNLPVSRGARSTNY
ncbi:MAG: hypothetical protein HYZ38_21975 [Mycobacterium sp.]|nr:hypothetical protein [Mycobacterium sp.]